MSATCEVCGANCRGSCAKCGARLCAVHKPKSARAKCSICSAQKHGADGRAASTTTARPSRSQKQQPGRRSAPVPGTAYYTPRKPPDFKNMTPNEVRNFALDCMVSLERKRRRERAYLDRRASCGKYTPTDEAYEDDQLLEFDLLDLLRHILQEISDDDTSNH